jgi:hypothetical protein
MIGADFRPPARYVRACRARFDTRFDLAREVGREQTPIQSVRKAVWSLTITAEASRRSAAPLKSHYDRR